MGLNTLIVILAALVLVLIIARRRVSSKPAAKSADEATVRTRKIALKSTPFHSVSIKPGLQSCRAAREMQGRRFLSRDAPSLPLPGCTLVSCACTFAHHGDRRANKDRRSDLPRGIGQVDDTGKQREERRQTRERRHDDNDDSQA